MKMRMHLQPWYDHWLEEHKDTGLLYARSGERVQLGQVHFVRDDLGPLFWSGVPYDERPVAGARADCRETALVVGEHHSKSVRLPVYALERPDIGLRVILRDNWYDWNVSVIAEKPVDADLRGFQLDYLRDEERERSKDEIGHHGSWGYCFFQGFPEGTRFGPYARDRARFSTWMRGDHELFTFMWLVLRAANPNFGRPAP